MHVVYDVTRILCNILFRKGELEVNPKDEDLNTYDYLNKLKWTPEEVKDLQDHIDKASGYREHCNMANSQRSSLGGGWVSFGVFAMIPCAKGPTAYVNLAEVPWEELRYCSLPVDPCVRSDLP